MIKFSDIENICSADIRIVRDCSFNCTYLVGKEFDESKQNISFIGNKKYIEDFLKYNCVGVVCTEDVALELKGQYNGGIITSQNPKTAFFEIHNYIGKKKKILKDTVISGSANIHHKAIIADKNVVIGANSTVCANVAIKEGTQIGENCIIRENTIIGSPAFYYYGENDNRRLVQSTGGVLIGNNVEIHTSCTIEKSVMFGNTVIGDNTKIDNLTLIGHDSQIGENCTIAAMGTFAGGVTLGAETFVGVGATFAPYVSIGKNAKISTGAVVTKDVASGQQVSGNFAIDHDKFIRQIKNISK